MNRWKGRPGSEEDPPSIGSFYDALIDSSGSSGDNSNDDEGCSDDGRYEEEDEEDTEEEREMELQLMRDLERERLEQAVVDDELTM